MTQYGFFFDQQRCLGCATCTVACKEWNEGRRGDAAFSTLTDTQLGAMATPTDWVAGTASGTTNHAFNRRFHMKETWRKVSFHEFGDVAPNVSVVPLSMACNHCSDPACMKVCPVKAITKEEVYGAVVVDSSRCVGCGACRAACPWEVPQYYDALEKTPMGSEKHPRMTKCDMCVDRLKVGLKPACVASCPGRALDCGPMDELKKRHPIATVTAVGVIEADVAKTRPNVLFRARTVVVK